MVSLSLHFNGHFPGGSGCNGAYSLGLTIKRLHVQLLAIPVYNDPGDLLTRVINVTIKKISPVGD